MYPINQHKVAIYLPDLSDGGEERILINLAGMLTEDDIQVDIVLAKSNGPLLKSVSPKSNIIQFETRITLSLFKLIRYLRAYRPAALLSSLELTNLIALLAVKLSGVQCKTVIRVAVAVSEHKRLRWKKVLEKQVLRRIYPLADEIIAVSDGVKADLVQFAGLDEEKITTIYNPIVTKDMIKNADALIHHKWVGNKHEPPVILRVGRFSKQKDFPTLIKAFSLLIQEVPARLVILGDGTERPVLEKIAHELNIQTVVDFPGFVDNPYPYFLNASVFVLSSRWEGLPSVLIEALALGCPVVSTDCPYGPDEILNAGKYGEIVPMEDIGRISAVIKNVITGHSKKSPPESWIAQFSMETIYPKNKEILGLQ